MKKLFALLFAIALPAAAQALDANEVKNTHINNCTSNGGDRTICSCSYNKALKVMTLEELALVNSQLRGADAGVDRTLSAKLEGATRECADEATATAKAESGLLPPPPPPPLPTLDPIPSKDSLGAPIEDKTYLGDIKRDPDSIPNSIIDSAEVAPNKETVDKKIAQNEVETYASSEEDETYVEPVKPKRPAGYFGEYDKRFFDAIAKGDANPIRAYSTRVYDFDVKNQDGDTAMIVAITNGQAPSVSFLISKGASVNAKNTRGQAPLHVASYIKRPDIVELLINARADVNSTYGVGYTPLTLAVMQQDYETVELLLKAKAKLNRALADGNTELHIAAANTNADIVGLLVNNGAKLNARNKAGFTPLMIAAYTGNVAVVEKLAALGADVKLKDPAGRNAITLANAAGKMDVVNSLMVYQK